MENAELDMMVTSAAIRLELQKLEAKMIKLQSNVKDEMCKKGHQEAKNKKQSHK